jgi:hypothetical protein
VSRENAGTCFMHVPALFFVPPESGLSRLSAGCNVCPLPQTARTRFALVRRPRVGPLLSPAAAASRRRFQTHSSLATVFLARLGREAVLRGVFVAGASAASEGSG